MIILCCGNLFFMSLYVLVFFVCFVIVIFIC